MNVAFIPVRGGSKSIPLKNIKTLCGKPLVYWTAKAACQCKYIDLVYISTDSEKIVNAVKRFAKEEKFLFSKIRLIGRSEKNASDFASTESVMLEFAEQYDFENIVLIQATSPLLEAKDLEGGFELYNSDNTDSVLSVVRQKRFLWNTDAENIATAANYDVFHRPRRQDFDGYLMENGAFYITSRKSLEDTGNRISGIIRAYEMPEYTAVEIDEQEDFLIIEELLQNRLKDVNRSEKKTIRMVVTDCDGCLTDGGMYYSEKGDELKKFNTKDGMALASLHEKGIITGIITGENMELNIRRAQKLGLDFIKQGVRNKLQALNEICKSYSVELDEVLYIGDDINDLEVMNVVGYCACPADAVKPVRMVSGFIAERKGGEGAVREIVDYLMNSYCNYCEIL